MKIFVTGSAGFIGFHVAKRLLELGHDVTGIDNLNTYYDIQLKFKRNHILNKYPSYAFFIVDIYDKYMLDSLFKTMEFDMVCHLAAQAGVRYSIENPDVYINSNIHGFHNILEECRHNNIKRLVYASSSSVYGGNTKLPFSESDLVDTPISLYAATKKSNELMAHCYTSLYGIQTIGLRFFTVYGEWGRPDMAMWLFTEAIMNNKPIKVYNNGDMQRDFTYIDDIVDGIMAALFGDNLNPYEIFNLGNNKPEELMGVIGIIERELGKKADKKLLPMQPGDVESTYADILQAKNKLGFEPKTDIAVGIPRFIKWYKGYIR